MTRPSNERAQTGDFEFAALEAAANYRRALVEEFAPFLGGDVLEVGAGVGQFTSALAAVASIRRLVSIEPDPRCCRGFRSRHPSRALVEGTLADLEERSGWNAVVSVNVLEHIRDDEAELARYASVLSETSGHLCLFVPARPEIYAPIDRDFGHFRRYTRGALADRLKGAGFSSVRLHYFNWLGYFAWWLNFCVLQKRRFSIPSVRFFDRVLFPWVHGVERRLIRPPLGQSLIAVARSTGSSDRRGTSKTTRGPDESGQGEEGPPQSRAAHQQKPS